MIPYACTPGGPRGEPVVRWAWQILIAVEAVNLLDWTTTVVGAGVLGLPEQGRVTAYLMHHLGVVWGATVIKALAALAFAAFAAAAIRVASLPQPGGATAAAGLLWGLAYACLMLAQTVLWNVINIWQAAGGRRPP
jgi:uncharacterized membrane protein